MENGYFSFKGHETGNDFADFLLGAPDGFQQASPSAMDGRSRYIGVYANDSFKLRPNFTLNYGLRWEMSQPWLDTQNRITTFIPGFQSTRYPDAPLGWAISGDSGISRSMMPTRFRNFAPRLGIAFSPNTTQGLLGKLFGGPGKTSFRAGAGIFHQALEGLIDYYSLANAPFANYWTSPTQVYLEEPFEDRIQGNNPGQRFPWVPEPNGATGFWAEYQPIAGEGGPWPDNSTPYMEQYNFNIQRQIGNSAILTLAYVGSEGHHLIGQVDPDPASAAKCLQIAALETAQGQPGLACGPEGEDSIYTLPSGVTFYGTRPYSVTSGRYLSQGLLDFGAGLGIFTTWANSDYNSLQVSLEKRIGAVRFLAAYTWSKSIDDLSGFTDGPNQGMNPFNHNLSRAPSAFNMPQNFVVSYVYDLPFRKALHSNQGRLYKFLDGWQLSGITRFATGQPINMGEDDDLSLCNCDGVGLPDWNGQMPQIFNPRKNAKRYYFSTSQFSTEVLGQLGTSAPRFFSGPGLNNWALSLHKTTKVTERLGVEFRAEFFNAFNHVQFNSPDGDISDSTFGWVTSAGSPRIGQVALKLTF
jgi:hypothetical protein